MNQRKILQNLKRRLAPGAAVPQLLLSQGTERTLSTSQG